MPEVFIYFIENNLNGKIYVGKTVNPKIRWKAHKSISRSNKEKYGDKYLIIHAAMAKYGIANFSFTVAECYDGNDAASEAEKYWISYLKDFGIKIYNVSDGGDGVSPGTKFTEERKSNISRAKLGKKASNEARANMSIARKFEFAGEKNNKAKITESIVKDIIKLYQTGEYSHRQLAKIHKLTHATIGKIIRRELWSHVAI